MKKYFVFLCMLCTVFPFLSAMFQLPPEKPSSQKEEEEDKRPEAPRISSALESRLYREGKLEQTVQELLQAINMQIEEIQDNVISLSNDLKHNIARLQILKQEVGDPSYSDHIREEKRKEIIRIENEIATIRRHLTEERRKLGWYKRRAARLRNRLKKSKREGI